MVTSAMISFVSEAVNTFITWLNTWYEQANVRVLDSLHMSL